MNRYLVTYEIEGKLCEPQIETALQIFNRMEMDDCYDIAIRNLQWLRPYSSWDEMRTELHMFPTCEFYGTWCCRDEDTGKIVPLRMEIRKKFGDREILDIGYAEDH